LIFTREFNVVCAREGGANTTLLFLAAHFAKQNTNSVGVQSEGEAEGGCGGNSASPEPKRSPAALIVQSRVPQKSFLFLLEEKEIARQIKNAKKTFLRNSERSERRRGGAFKFRSPDFRQKKFGFRPTNTTILN
jgi:hypothetical protein